MSIFQKSVTPKIDFSTFPLGRNSLITCNFGQIVPCFVQEVLPNDHFKVRGASNIQFAPMVAPMMQDVYVSYHYFYVPNRILYKYFETAFTGCKDGRRLPEEDIPAMPGLNKDDMNSRVQFYVDIDDIGDVFASGINYFVNNNGTLSDYLEVPNRNFNPEHLSEDFFLSDLPFRAYFKIWYDWYRDENLQITDILGNDYYDDWDVVYSTRYSHRLLGLIGEVVENEAFDFPSLVPSCKYRSYKKDYFTACLPSPQKGEPVTISLGDNAPVVGSIAASDWSALGSTISVQAENGITSNLVLNAVPDGGTGSGKLVAGSQDVQGLHGDYFNATPTGLSVDLSQATAVTINELRTAFALQRILEAMSIGGSRYNEYLLSQYGTAPEDLRLQRAQFLGGWTQKVAVQQVIQTGGDLSNSQFMNQPGYAAGRMFSAGSDFVFAQQFKEPGYIIGLMSVMPKAGYFQGIPRHLTRKHRFDYYNPKFAFLGEQAVKNQEIYFSGTDYDDKTFGYMMRWAEYRTSYDTIHGDFKGSLKHYHMYREFDSMPTLSEDFILTKDVDTRPFVLWKEQTNQNHLIWANIYHDVIASRPLPYSVMPGIHA